MIRFAKDVKVPVSLIGLSTQGHLIITVAASIFVSYGYDCIITGVTEGKHKAGSKHYTGCAVDFRKHHLPPVMLNSIVTELKERFSTEFDVVEEDSHIHVEWDPKVGPNVA